MHIFDVVIQEIKIHRYVLGRGTLLVHWTFPLKTRVSILFVIRVSEERFVLKLSSLTRENDGKCKTSHQKRE